MVFAGRLGPGEVSPPLNLVSDFGKVTVALDLGATGDANDCDATNDSTEVGVSISDCF